MVPRDFHYAVERFVIAIPRTSISACVVFTTFLFENPGDLKAHNNNAFSSSFGSSHGGQVEFEECP